MTILKNTFAGAAAAMLIASPVMAQADRTAAPTQEGEQAFGGGPLLGLAVFAAIVTAIVVVSDNDDEPVSP